MPRKKKEPEPKKEEPPRFSIVSAPTVLVVDEAVGQEELQEVLRERAEQMGLPLSRVVDSGLFRVFREEVQLSQAQSDIEFQI